MENDSVLNPVQLNLRIQRGRFDVKQTCGPSLVAPRLIQSQPYQTTLKAFDLFVEVNSLSYVHSLQAIRLFGEGTIARERFRLSHQGIRQLEQSLHARAHGPFGNFEMSRRDW